MSCMTLSGMLFETVRRLLTWFSCGEVLHIRAVLPRMRNLSLACERCPMQDTGDSTAENLCGVLCCGKNRSTHSTAQNHHSNPMTVPISVQCSIFFSRHCSSAAPCHCHGPRACQPVHVRQFRPARPSHMFQRVRPSNIDTNMSPTTSPRCVFPACTPRFPPRSPFNMCLPSFREHANKRVKRKKNNIT